MGHKCVTTLFGTEKNGDNEKAFYPKEAPATVYLPGGPKQGLPNFREQRRCIFESRHHTLQQHQPTDSRNSLSDIHRIYQVNNLFIFFLFFWGFNFKIMPCLVTCLGENEPPFV